MLLVTIILLVVLFYWRLFVVKDLNLLTTVFWIIFPDLGSFIPIGLTMRGAKEWRAGDPLSTTSSILSWSGFLSSPSGASFPEPYNGRFSAGQVTSRLTALSDTISEPHQGEKSIRSYEPVVWLTGLPLKQRTITFTALSGR